MRTPNVKNYLNFLTEAQQKGYANQELCVKHKINTRTTASLKRLNLLDKYNNFTLIESPSLLLAKKIIEENRSNYQKHSTKKAQTEIVFDEKKNKIKYNNVRDQRKTEILKLRLTPQEKEYLNQVSKKANKTISKYVVEKLGLHKIDHNSIVVKQKPTTSKSKNITLFWGLIKITK